MNYFTSFFASRTKASAPSAKEFLETLIRAGYSPELAHSLAVFQVNGCFKAAKTYGHDEAKWREVRGAIDTFVCGGLAHCSLQNNVQPGK